MQHQRSGESFLGISIVKHLTSDLMSLEHVTNIQYQFSGLSHVTG